MNAQNIVWKIYFPRCITTRKIEKMFHHSSSRVLHPCAWARRVFPWWNDLTCQESPKSELVPAACHCLSPVPSESCCSGPHLVLPGWICSAQEQAVVSLVGGFSGIWGLRSSSLDASSKATPPFCRGGYTQTTRGIRLVSDPDSGRREERVK
jgi:hypothetical protein